MTGPMSALVWAGGHQAVVTTCPRPATGDGWVLVDVAYCGICGTDLHIHNSFPSWPPVTLGHEFTGRLAALGAEVDRWPVGARPGSGLADRTTMCRLRTSASCGGGFPGPHEHETEPPHLTTHD